jgi:N-acetylmuramoyl-L-alanine amidase-like protein
VSVGFARAVEQGLRRNSVPVSFEPGWETRGNGQSFPDGKPQGLITHHTGADYGSGLPILVKGRSDLPGPLCNACTYPDGRIHIIAAHPANHAGASGGRSMGPLPTTTLFNRLVWGNEVMFPGTKPWTPQQYRSARVLAGVICGILGYRDAEHCRGHAETSRAGKWDPGAGRGAGVPFDMASFRRNVWAALHQPPVTRSPRRDPGMELPPTTTRIDKQLPTDVVGGWCGQANLLLTANTGGARVYGVYAVVDRGPVAPDVRPLLKDDAGRQFEQWRPFKAKLPDGTTSVVINYTATQGMLAHAEYEH